ncbi:MAG: imidazole glycerol phosphate synthase subunit HisH [Caulobacteraceae bacterium]|nr:imidazole glycerol phosphate synthase subunit HisH [Caulobacteraceae bacterium]
MITIIDYGMGNVGSVQNMLHRVGAESVLSTDPESILRAEKLILPGVGSFDQGMQALQDRNLADAIRSAVTERGIPILGICLGMQLLSRRSDEGSSPGLGLHASETLKIPSSSVDGKILRIPHMGWNIARPLKEHPLVEGVAPDTRFYFVHSYHVVCDDPADALMAVDYGSILTAAFSAGLVMGVQFHPEKSHKFGMALLKNYAERPIC